MNNKLARVDLETVREVFEKHECPFFLLYGTALGAYRDGEFLPGDADIDLGVFGLEKRLEIYNDLLSEGFKWAAEAKAEKSPGWLKLKRLVEIEIFFFMFLPEEFKEEFVAPISNTRSEMSGGYVNLRFPIRFNKTETIRFHGKDYQVLSPIEEFLEWSYGDWRDKTKRNQTGTK